MAHQSLYRRYRPRRFAEVLGQDHAVRALRNAVRDGTPGHAYLFSGPRGTGKTSTARILAKALNCEAPVDGEPCGMCTSCQSFDAGTSVDLHEHDAASRRRIDEMRDLLAGVHLGTSGRFKVYILDEVHQLTGDASSALLKVLEEPPAHVIWILATTDPEKVLPTIRSRTQHFEFTLLDPDLLEKHVRAVAADAGIPLDDDAALHVVRQARGSARDALSALDQVAAAGGVVADAPSLDEILDALAERDGSAALAGMARLCAAGRDPRRIASDLVGDLRDAFLALMAPELVALPSGERDRVAERARRLGPALTVRAMEVLGDALVALRDAPDPRVVVDVALVRLARPDADVSSAALLQRIEQLERAVAAGGGQAASVPPGSASSTAGSPSPAADGMAPIPAGSPPAPPDTPAAAPPPAEADEPSLESPPGDGSLPTEGFAGARAALRSRSSGEGQGSGSTVPAGRRPAKGTAPGIPPAPPSPGRGGAAPERAPLDEPSASPATPSSDPERATATATAGEPGTGAASAGGPVPGRDDLTLAWGDSVLGSLSSRAKARFSGGRFVDVRGNTAVFALPNPVHRDRCADCRAEVEGALSAHFGTSLQLELVVDDDPGSGAGAAAPQAAGRAADPEPAEADDVDLSELRDAPGAVASGVDALTEAFPGAELVDGGEQ